jgi:hypothetical protein
LIVPQTNYMTRVILLKASQQKTKTSNRKDSHRNPNTSTEDN